MNPTIVGALWITLIGMGLVFLSLLLLWGLMALIVSLTAKQAEAESAGEDEGEAEESQPEEVPSAQPETAILHQKAAATAVAVALSMQKKGKLQATASHPMLQSEGEAVSAWQPVLRANQLTQKSRMFTRKQRGNGQ
jgi:Na+-transporting methylmalonyl-CoA/oxaloacetate decarboxylase gamma subunit